MMSCFVTADRDNCYLFPPSVTDWLPEDLLARVVVEVIDQLDLSELTPGYAGRGSKAHHPAVLLGSLIYGYATGALSSRKIERATYNSIAFRYLVANTHSDHDTIATFRRRFLLQLEALFVQLLLLAREMKLIKLGQIAFDGTKVKAKASKHKALTADAGEADHTLAVDGMDIPAETTCRETRLNALAAAKAAIEERAQERFEQELAEYQSKQ